MIGRKNEVACLPVCPPETSLLCSWFHAHSISLSYCWLALLIIMPHDFLFLSLRWQLVGVDGRELPGPYRRPAGHDRMSLHWSKEKIKLILSCAWERFHYTQQHLPVLHRKPLSWPQQQLQVSLDSPGRAWYFPAHTPPPAFFLLLSASPAHLFVHFEPSQGASVVGLVLPVPETKAPHVNQSFISHSIQTCIYTQDPTSPDKYQ